jgi:RNA polymerase sigma-70 factor (ECF subfamily)
VNDSNALDTGLAVTAASDSDAAAPRAADTGEFRRLYQQHSAFVWRSLRRLGVDEDHLDDLTQDVFLIAFRDQARFEHRSSFQTWLYGIAFNLSRHHARKTTRFPTEPVTETLRAASPSPQDELARNEAVRTLYAVLDTLPPERRAVFVMTELEQMSAVEIAELTGAPVNTVYSRLRLARQDFEIALARLQGREVRRNR